MEYKVGYKFKNLRKRILEIGASYVGQVTENKKIGKDWTRAYFEDPKFEKKMREVGWFLKQKNPNIGHHYCNNFVRLVYKEAMSEGNSYVSSTTARPNTWNNRGSGGYLVPPVNVDGGTNIEEWVGSGQKTYGAQNPLVESTRKSYQIPNRYVSITNNPTFDKGISGNKNLGSAIKMKEYTESNKILPGDFVTFDWNAASDNKSSSKSSGRFNQHIGIYIAPATSDYSKIYCIEGNCTSNGRNGVWIKTRNISTVNGFGQLITRNNL